MKSSQYLTALFVGIAGLLLVLAANSRSSDKIVWKPIPRVILLVDEKAPKIWDVYHTGKKVDPLLLKLGDRLLVIFIHNQEVYELNPAQLEHKGPDLLWLESDKPDKPVPTSDWNTRDVGSAWRVRLKLDAEGRQVEIQIPQVPDLRGLY